MRLTFISDDSMVIINGVPAHVDLTGVLVPDGLHAIQTYPAHFVSGRELPEGGHEDIEVPAKIECEWKNSSNMAIGNSLGDAGLPFGFIDPLHEVAIISSQEPVSE